MKAPSTTAIVTLATVLLYTGALVWWHLYTPHSDLEASLPGADNRPADLARAADDVRIGEFFMKYDVPFTSGDKSGVFPSFRGAGRDNIIHSDIPLNTQGDFPILWEVTTGEGHAAPVIYKGRVYILDYDEPLLSDMLRCIDLESGGELWRRWYRVRMKRNHGFSRTVPAVGDGFVVTLGPSGQLMCCDPLTGDLLWSRDLGKEYGTEVPFWYTGQCPLIDGNEVIVAPAGKEALLAGYDLRTGEELWSTPNSPSFTMSHSSVMPMVLGGKKTYVYVGIGGVCGVSAALPDKGKLLWSTERWQPSVVAPSPVRMSSGRIFLVAGYGNGGAVLQVSGEGGQWNARILEAYKADKGFSSEQQTPILYGGKFYGIIPKDGGPLRERLVQYDPSDLHHPLWSSGPEERFGLGPYMIINDVMLVLAEEGTLFLYKMNEGGVPTLIRKQEVFEAIDAWGPLCYADGRLLVRDSHRVLCLKVDS